MVIKNVSQHKFASQIVTGYDPAARPETAGVVTPRLVQL